MRVRVNNGQSYCNDGPAIDSHDDMMRNNRELTIPASRRNSQPTPYANGRSD